MNIFRAKRAAPKRIAARLIGVIIVFGVSMTAIATAVQLKIEYDREVEVIERRFIELANSDVDAISQNVWLLDVERLNIILLGLSRVPDFAHVEVRDEGNNILSTIGRHEGIGKDDIIVERGLSYSHRGQVREIGSFHLAATTENVFSRITEEAARIFIVNAFIIFALAGVIYWAVDWIVTRHMARMAEYAQNLSLENLDIPLELNRKETGADDELTDLVSAINQMRASLRSSYADLRKLNEELEVQVAERTYDLNKQKTLFESVFQGVPDALLVVGPDRNILMYNTATCNIFGYEPDEIIGQYTSILYESEEEYERQGQLRYNLNADDLSKPYTVNYARKNGELFPGETVGAVMRDEDGKTLGFLGVIRDVSERNLLQAQLIQSSKMATLGEMATGVAHELNQPLNIIRMAVDNIRRKSDKGEIEPDYLNGKIARVTTQTERAAAIINHMRAFGRKASTEMVDIDLRDPVNGALDMMAEQLHLSGIYVAVELPDQPVMAKGQSVQLEQVLINLLSNARDVLSDVTEGPKQIIISVSKSPKSGRAHLTVRDTGGGIPEDAIGRVFEPFFTTKEVGKGTGLGLSIVYSLVQDMGGTIDVHNADGGAEFNIVLPAEVSQS